MDPGNHAWQKLCQVPSRVRVATGLLRRSLVLPNEVAHWSLSTLRERLVKIGARIVRHGRYLVFQLAEVAVPRTMFATILCRIDRLRGPPVAAA
jgi:hypothetical protein